MCGIAGIVNSKLNRQKIETMLDKIAHRGPDGSGLWIDSKKHVGFGHRRLAIIDPERGAQPFFNEDDTVVLVFNGCIYNYLELRQILIQKGHTFKSYSDTEVIVHAYEEYGVDCVSHFNGMFSFAIWDLNEQKLFCARDRLGIKPFYYKLENNSIIFASEIKAILTQTGRVDVSEESLAEYITFQISLGEKTFFNGIKKLQPGHRMIFSLDGECFIDKYWDIDFTIDHHHTEGYFVDRLKMLIEDSVKMRLRSDVPLGSHLSGGLDSSTVVSMASSLLPGMSLKTFTGAFDFGEAFDESRHAKTVSDACGTEHFTSFFTSEDFTDNIQKIIYFMDEPSAGPGVFPQFLISKLAASKVKVALGGQGGDEMFLGYARYLVAYLEECISGAIGESGDSDKKYVATLASIIPNLSLLKNYTPMLQYFWQDNLFGSSNERYFRLMDRSEGITSVFTSDVKLDKERIFSEFNDFFSGSNAKSLINKMSYFDLKTHLPALLHVEDRTSMAWSLESRVPLLDHRIVELVASIPPVIKFKNGQGKYIFKEAIKHMVPSEIFHRKDKMGFPVPLVEWYKTGLKDFIRDILFSQKARERGLYNMKEMESLIDKEASFSRKVWGLLCIELWHNTFIDNKI